MDSKKAGAGSEVHLEMRNDPTLRKKREGWGTQIGGAIPDGWATRQMLSGPLDFWNDHWAGPAGMGVPGGQGDWAASMHDYNFNTNGITLGTYFNPTVSPQTARALIQSNNNLIHNTGGFQGAKMGLFFGVVNAFQWLSHAF